MPAKKPVGVIRLPTAFKVSGRLPVGLVMEKAYEAGQLYSRQRVGLGKKKQVL